MQILVKFWLGLGSRDTRSRYFRPSHFLREKKGQHTFENANLHTPSVSNLMAFSQYMFSSLMSCTHYQAKD